MPCRSWSLCLEKNSHHPSSFTPTLRSVLLFATLWYTLLAITLSSTSFLSDPFGHSQHELLGCPLSKVSFPDEKVKRQLLSSISKSGRSIYLPQRGFLVPIFIYPFFFFIVYFLSLCILSPPTLSYFIF